MKSDELYLERITKSAEKIIRATSNITEDAFAASETISAAVILWLTQIGELTKRLSQKTKEQYAIPWKEVAGFRDIAVHDYFELSLRDVWITATVDIPQLLRILSSKTP